MDTATRAKLDLEYKKFQWYAEILGDSINDLDDEFIRHYDALNFLGMRKALGKMSDILNSYEGSKYYKTWSDKNEQS